MHRIVSSLLVFVCLLGGAAPAASQDAPPPEPDGGPALQDWAGPWYTSFGFVDLTVDDDGRVTGTYSCCRGKIEGKAQGVQIEFSWEDPIYGDGWGYWYWRDHGSRLRGMFGKMEDMGIGGQWNAVRLGEPDLGETPIEFAVRAEHPRFETFRGELKLSGTEGDALVGTLRGAYDLEAQGQPFKYEMWNTLTGRHEGDALVLEWLDPLHETLGTLRMTRSEDGAWTGTWQPHFTDGDDEPMPMRWIPSTTDSPE